MVSEVIVIQLLRSVQMIVLGLSRWIRIGRLLSYTRNRHHNRIRSSIFLQLSFEIIFKVNNALHSWIKFGHHSLSTFLSDRCNIEIHSHTLPDTITHPFRLLKFVVKTYLIIVVQQFHVSMHLANTIFITGSVKMPILIYSHLVFKFHRKGTNFWCDIVFPLESLKPRTQRFLLSIILVSIILMRRRFLVLNL